MNTYHGAGMIHTGLQSTHTNEGGQTCKEHVTGPAASLKTLIFSSFFFFFLQHQSFVGENIPSILNIDCTRFNVAAPSNKPLN